MSCHSQWGSPCSEPLGFCSNDSICICTLPATAIGDLAVQQNEDCGLDMMIMRAFWVSCAVLHSMAFIINSVTLIFSGDLQVHEVKLICTMLVCSFCFVILGSLEGSATFPGQRSIGIDPLTTVLFVVGGSVYWILLEVEAFSQTRLTYSALGSDKALWFREIHRKSIPLQVLTSTIAFLVLFGIISDPANAYSYAAVHYLLLGILIVVVSLSIVVSLTVIMRDVRRAVTSSGENQIRLERMLFVLSNLRGAVLFQIFTSGSISFAFGISRMLMRKSPYFLAIIWSTVALPFMAIGASRLANSTQFRFPRYNYETPQAALLSSHHHQSLMSRISLGRTSTPKSTRLTKRHRKQWKGAVLDKVEENLVSTSEDAFGPKSQD